MSGIGEVTAIITLIGTAVKLSQAIYGTAAFFYESRQQIESLGSDVETLGGLLRQAHQLFNYKLTTGGDADTVEVFSGIIDQCDAIFLQLSAFRESLAGLTTSDSKKPSFFSRVKLASKTKELNYLQKRLESVKTNLLLLITLEISRSSQQTSRDAPQSHQILPTSCQKEVTELVSRSHSCSESLEHLELEAHRQSLQLDGPADRRGSGISFQTLSSLSSSLSRSTLDSVLGLYGFAASVNEGKRWTDDALPGNQEVPHQAKVELVTRSTLTHSDMGNRSSFNFESSDPSSSSSYGDDSDTRTVRLKSSQSETEFDETIPAVKTEQSIFGHRSKIEFSDPPVSFYSPRTMISRGPDVPIRSPLRPDEASPTQRAVKSLQNRTKNAPPVPRSPTDSPTYSFRSSVLFAAASISDFTPGEALQSRGFRLLKCVVGEVFDIFDEYGDLWLARSLDHPSNQSGWILFRNLLKLDSDVEVESPTVAASMTMTTSSPRTPNQKPRTPKRSRLQLENTLTSKIHTDGIHGKLLPLFPWEKEKENKVDEKEGVEKWGGGKGFRARNIHNLTVDVK